MSPLCAEMSALHLEMPHQVYCCLSNQFENLVKAGPLPKTSSASLSSVGVSVKTQALWREEFRVPDFVSSSVPSKRDCVDS